MARHTVAEQDLAVALGSGDVPVLATPRLIAWFEAATVAAIRPAIPEGSTTVGVRVAAEHLAASPLGAEITVTAVVREQLPRRVVFDCQAVDGAGVLVGRATVERAVVRRESFLARLAR